MDIVLTWLFLGLIVGGVTFFLRGRKDLEKKLLPWIISGVAGAGIGGFSGYYLVIYNYSGLHISPLMYSLAGSFLLVLLVGRRFTKRINFRKESD